MVKTLEEGGTDIEDVGKEGQCTKVDKDLEGALRNVMR